MRLVPFLLLSLAPLALSAGAPPVRESLSLSHFTLNRLVLRPASRLEPAPLPPKREQLPLSVQLFLRPSGQLDLLAGSVQRAAAQVRRQVAPGASQAALLRETPRLAEAVRAWLDQHLPLDPAVDWQSRPATDRRLAWPKASQIIGHGRSDADGRVLAAVAVLRALGVPARTAYARGRLAAQYWVPARQPPAPAPAASAQAQRAPRPPLGWWALLDEGLHEAEVDAWSLEPGVLAKLLWKPAQELRAPAEGWQRAVFAEGDSPTARAAFEASVELGRLTATAGALDSLSAAAQAALEGLTRGTATLWVLTAQHYRLKVDGAMMGMDPVDILTPYRPHLGDPQREARSVVREMELEAQGLWSDRPRRLRLVNGRLRDEWKSPPPALGVQHYSSFGLRRFGSVLQAQRQGDAVSGRLLRADNLSPRAGWEISVTPHGLTAPTRTIHADADGRFSLDLDPQEAAAEWVLLSTPEEPQLLWRGDQQRLRRPELEQLPEEVESDRI